LIIHAVSTVRLTGSHALLRALETLAAHHRRLALLGAHTWATALLLALEALSAHHRRLCHTLLRALETLSAHHGSATLLRPLESLTAHHRATALLSAHTRALALATALLLHHGAATLEALSTHHGTTSLLHTLETLGAHTRAAALLLTAHHRATALLTAHTRALTLATARLLHHGAATLEALSTHHGATPLLRSLESLSAHTRAAALLLTAHTRALALATALLLHHGSTPLLRSLESLSTHTRTTALWLVHHGAAILLAAHHTWTLSLAFLHGLRCILVLLHARCLLLFGLLFQSLGRLFLLLHLEGTTACRLGVATDFALIGLLFICIWCRLMALSHCAGKRSCAGDKCDHDMFVHGVSPFLR
jgi:hypothetical protein